MSNELEDDWAAIRPVATPKSPPVVTPTRLLTRRMVQDAAQRIRWFGSPTDFVTDLLHELGLPDEFKVRPL